MSSNLLPIDEQKRFLKAKSNFKEQSPIGLLFISQDSIFPFIARDYLILMIINLIITYFIGLEFAKTWGFVDIIKRVAGYFKAFPSEALVFALSYTVSRIGAKTEEYLKDSIPFLEETAFKVSVAVEDEKLRKAIYRRFLQMTTIAFKHLDENVDLRGLLRIYGDDIFLLSEWAEYEKREKNFSTDIFYFGFEIHNLVRNRPEAEAIDTITSEVLKKCRNLQMYNTTRVPFAHFQTVAIVAIFFIFHDFMDTIPVDSADNYFSDIFRFTVHYLLFIGWLNIAIIEYFPYGKNQKFHLLEFAVSNIVLGTKILNMNRKQNPLQVNQNPVPYSSLQVNQNPPAYDSLESDQNRPAYGWNVLPYTN